MRWFKHYSDNYRGRSVHGLFDELGHVGVASYYIMLEICAEKLNKAKNVDLDETDMIFGFSERFLRQNLRISSTKLEHFLNISQTFGLLSYKKIEKTFEIKMPILLDLLDSDFKKTRSRRVDDALETVPDRDRDKDKDIYKAEPKNPVLKFDFEIAYNLYPLKKGKLTGINKLKRDIKTQADFNLLLLSIKNYANDVRNNRTELKFVKHFSTFTGCWRDWTETANVVAFKPKLETIKNEHFAELKEQEKNSTGNAFENPDIKNMLQNLIGKKTL
jgi:hypothetical protein